MRSSVLINSPSLSVSCSLPLSTTRPRTAMTLARTAFPSRCSSLGPLSYSSAVSSYQRHPAFSSKRASPMRRPSPCPNFEGSTSNIPRCLKSWAKSPPTTSTNYLWVKPRTSTASKATSASVWPRDASSRPSSNSPASTSSSTTAPPSSRTPGSTTPSSSP